MKVIIYIFLYIILTMVYFFTLSLIGTLWTDYISVITNIDWFMVYLMVLHWWIVVLSLREYYEKHIKPLQDIFIF